MMKKNPETYNELKLVNNLLRLSSYYAVSQEFLDEAYDFLMKDKNNKIQAGKTLIRFVEGSNIVKEFSAQLKTLTIDGLVLTASILTIIPHYEPSSYSSGGSGGGSSNNNNNNNNNH